MNLQRLTLLSLAFACAVLSFDADAESCNAITAQGPEPAETVIKAMEAAWLQAEYGRDDTLLDCMLDRDYRLIATRKAEVRDKSHLLANVKAGKFVLNGPMPVLETTVAVNGKFATAYSVMRAGAIVAPATEPAVLARFVDTYVLTNGHWRAVTGVDL